MLNELKKLENEFVGYLRDELNGFLSAIKEYDFDKSDLSKEVIYVINKIDAVK